jgi:hypothetical protein
MTERSSENIVFYGPFGASLLFVAGGWFWAWSVLGDIQSPLILHFSDYTGINQIGNMGDIHGLGATGAVIVTLNFILARALRSKEPRWARLLSGATLFLSVLLFTALAAIISVNQ